MYFNDAGNSSLSPAYNVGLRGVDKRTRVMRAWIRPAVIVLDELGHRAPEVVLSDRNHVMFHESTKAIMPRARSN